MINFPDKEYIALYELYNHTNGIYWDWRELNSSGIPWYFDTIANPCEENWEGIQCTIKGTPPHAQYTVTGINLSTRNLTGELPSTLYNLQNLRVLNLPYNNINGTIPSSYGMLQQLQHLGLTSNELTGTIPLELKNLTSFMHLGLDDNFITGTIPLIFYNQTSMRSILLSHNQLTGTIPQIIGTLTNLVYLYLNHNYFHGEIPENLGNLTKLAYFDLDSNQFIGQIPLNFNKLLRLHFLGLHNNQLTGSIPNYISYFKHLQFLYLNNNYFTSTIPINLGNLNKLLFLHIQYNYLSGYIPNSFNNLTKIQYLYMNNNNLIGTIPKYFSKFSNLNSLLIQNNNFHGNLYNIFNSTIQINLKTIQLSHNVFTGTLPNEIFYLPKLITLIIVSTCFEGSLPISICNAYNLETIVLDGLRTSNTCNKVIIPGFNGKIKKTNTFYGKIPSCLFDLKGLNTLHLSGNSLTGSINNNIYINNHLLDLDLSHNILTGSIPIAIQSNIWYNLDLSYNRFTGLLNSNFYNIKRNLTFDLYSENTYLNVTELNNTIALSLINNRLSGKIPKNLYNIYNISILTGNIFSCNIDKSDLPQYDSGKEQYSCCSNSFDVPYYIWLVLTTLCIVYIVVLYVYREKIKEYIQVTDIIVRLQKWLDILKSDNNNSSSNSSNNNNSDINSTDSVISSSNNSNNNDNKEINNSDSSNNTIPVAAEIRLTNIRYINKVFTIIEKATLLSLFFILFILLPVFTICNYYYGTHTKQYSYTVSMNFQSGVVPFYIDLFLLLVLLVLLVIGAIYTRKQLYYESRAIVRTESYDFETIQSLSKQRINEIQRWFVRIAYILINIIVVVGINSAFIIVALYQSTVWLVIAQILLSIFKVLWNLICSPFLIRWTANYLYSTTTIEQNSNNTTFFVLQLFISLFNNIIIPCFVVAIVDPNCFYNVFIPANSQTAHYLYGVCKIYAFQGCKQVVPQIASSTYNPSFTYSYQCSASFVTYYAPTFIYVCFVAIFISPLLQYIALLLHTKSPKETIVYRIIDRCMPVVLRPVDTTNNTPIIRNIYRPFFDANLIICTLITYLGVMLTFGVVFPPLAVALALTIFVVSYFAKLKIGRLLCMAINAKQWCYLDIIEVECRGAGTTRKLRQALRTILCICAIFYTLFLFDTLGNAVGFTRAVWVIFVVPCALPFIYIVINIYYAILRKITTTTITITTNNNDNNSFTQQQCSSSSDNNEGAEMINLSNLTNLNSKYQETDYKVSDETVNSLHKNC